VRAEQREEFALENVERHAVSTAVAPAKRLVTFSNRTSGRAAGSVQGANVRRALPPSCRPLLSGLTSVMPPR
jgi:hypothetical protein